MPAYKDEASVRGSWFFGLLRFSFLRRDEPPEQHEFELCVPPVQRAPPPEEVQDAR